MSYANWRSTARWSIPSWLQPQQRNRRRCNISRPTPGAPWGSIFATNTAYAGPWGVSYAPNITPSESSGIGIWTREIFVKALRTGKHWGESRPILPPMPWPAYARMTDEDLGAIYDYLRTIPPLENRVPDTRPAPGHGPSGGS